MIIGDRLRDIRKQNNLSQGDVEKRTGLLRCYISRVENGHTVPSIETLEKMAVAFSVPMYQFFYDGETPLDPPVIPAGESRGEEWGRRGRSARYLRKLQGLLVKMDDRERKLLLGFTQEVVRRNSH